MSALVFTKDGKQLISGSEMGTLIVWDVSEFGTRTSLNELGYVQLVIASPAGDDVYVVVESDDAWRMARVSASSTGAPSVVPFGHPDPTDDDASNFASDSGGTRFAWMDGKRVKLRNAGELEDSLILSVSSSYATKVAFGHADRILCIAGGPKLDPYRTEASGEEAKTREATTLLFVDVRTGNTLREVTAPHGDDVVALAGNPSLTGPAFVSVGRDSKMRFWSAKGQAVGEPIDLPVKLTGTSSTDIAFSQDGKYMAVAWMGQYGDDSSAYQIVDTATLTALRKPILVPGAITAFAFSPRGDMMALATSRNDTKSVSLRSLRGEPLGNIPIIEDVDVAGLAFDPNGEVLLGVFAWDGSRHWPVGPKHLIQVARSRYERLDARVKVDELIAVAGEALKAYDWDRIVTLLEPARKIEPSNDSVRVRLGNAYRWATTPQLAKAFHEYDVAIAVDSYDPVNYLQRGKLRLAMGDFAGAEQDFTSGLQTSKYLLRGAPSVVGLSLSSWAIQAGAAHEFNRLRGRAYLGAGKWAEAEADFDTAINGSPRYRAAQRYAIEVSEAMAAAYASEWPETAESWRAGAENWRKALTEPIINRTPDVHDQRGRARFGQKDYDGALADFETAITLLDDPMVPYSFDDAYGGKMEDLALRARKQAEFHGRLAAIHDARKDKDGANAERLAVIASLDRAHELAPKNAWILVERGRAKLDADLAHADVLADYFAAVAADPSNAAAHDYLVQILLWLEEYDRAHEAATSALKVVAEPTASLKARRAIAAWRLGMREDARLAWVKLKSAYSDLLAELARSSVPFWPNEVEAAQGLEPLTERPASGEEQVKAQTAR